MRQEKKKVDPTLLTKLLEYNRQEGTFIWKKRFQGLVHGQRDVQRWNARYAGKPALQSTDAKGYLTGRICSVWHRAHHVVWAFEHGRYPQDQLDHINHCVADNRISNLREVSNYENSHNQKRHNTNTSGCMGVSFYNQSQRWEAYIRDNGQKHHLGRFDSYHEAVAARMNAEKKFGFHENHGRVF